jgi:hypothetical protein
MNDQRPVSLTLRLRTHDLLIATNRDTSGRGYLNLREALERLQGRQIATDISTGGRKSSGRDPAPRSGRLWGRGRSA